MSDIIVDSGGAAPYPDCHHMMLRYIPGKFRSEAVDIDKTVRYLGHSLAHIVCAPPDHMFAIVSTQHAP
jgi:hypothetical protein